MYRWVPKFGPELTMRTEKHLRRASVDWHVDETYIRVGGRWRYLWRAIDANGQMVDFQLTARRDANAARAFLDKAIENRFVKDEFRPMMMIDESPGSLLDRFADYRAPHVKKWIGPEET